jgi:membrane-associated protease RseP (regulator of RpoE activity)
VSAAGPLPTSGASELERIRSTVATFFPVYETRVAPQSLILAIHIDPKTLEAKFDQLRQELGRQGYIPLLHRTSGEEFVEVVRRPKTGRGRPWVNLALLGATLLTTIFAGSLIWVTYVGDNALGASDFLYGALFFALPVLAILGLHESAHFLVARRRHLDASWPYFIPVPPPFIFGTFGAFISIREPFPDRKALFDVGAAGPVAGFLASIPISIAGLYLSVHSPVLPAGYCGPTVLGQSYANLLIGPTLFWQLLGLFLPKVTSLHPLALAGWVGLLVTAINLLPAGSLDGGHVFRALLGDRARFVSYAAALFLFALGFLFGYYGWILFGILVLFLGLRHPPPLNDITPLDRKRYIAGALVALVLLSGFSLVPIAEPPGALTLADAGVTNLHAASGVAANLSVLVGNGDPVPHGYVLTASISSVIVANGSSNRSLNRTELASWARNASWTFYLPAGKVYSGFAGGTASLPLADYVTIAGGGAATAVTSFADTEPAVEVGVSLSVQELCAAAGTGSASTGFSASFG